LSQFPRFFLIFLPIVYHNRTINGAPRIEEKWQMQLTSQCTSRNNVLLFFVVQQSLTFCFDALITLFEYCNLIG
jgi:hypothetical protein